MDSTFTDKSTNGEDSLPEQIVDPVTPELKANHAEKTPSNHFDDANVMNLNSSDHVRDSKDFTDDIKKPDAKALTEVFKQSFQEEKVKSRNGQNQYLYYLLVFVIMVVGLVLIWQLSMQRQIDSIKSSLEVTIVPNDPQDDKTTEIKKDIVVIKPEEFEEVTGQFKIALEVSAINNLAIKVFDDYGVELGGLIDSTIELVDGKGNIEKDIDLINSPTVETGYLVVYPADENINSPANKTVSIVFPQSLIVDKLNVTGPIENQLVNSTKIKIVGESKGFSSNKLGVKLVDSEAKVLIEKEINSLTDKTSAEFVKFDEIIQIGTLPDDISDTGSIEFFELSDLNKSSILTIPVRFR
jgi:hypothetical protein